MDRKKILIIDDEADFCMFVKMNLELGSKFEVEIALSGKEGIELAKRIKPDLILLDIIMPEMDGFEVLARLKKDKNTIAIPVVMLTARTDDTSKLRASMLYDEKYLTKTIETSQLKTEIEEVLRRRGNI